MLSNPKEEIGSMKVRIPGSRPAGAAFLAITVAAVAPAVRGQRLGAAGGGRRRCQAVWAHRHRSPERHELDLGARPDHSWRRKSTPGIRLASHSPWAKGTNLS